MGAAGVRQGGASVTHAWERDTGLPVPSRLPRRRPSAQVQPGRCLCAPVVARAAAAPASLRAVPTPDSLQIRPARPGDLAALVELEESTFSYDLMSPRQLRRHLASPRALLLLAQAPEGVLASALLFLRRGSSTARLYSLATAAAARGRGLGRRLLAAVEAAAAARGVQRIRLEVRRDNAAAVGLYEQTGYRRIAALPAYYDDGADAWRYEKTLGAAA